MAKHFNFVYKLARKHAGLENLSLNMAEKQQRVYVVETDQEGSPVSGYCHRCGLTFKFEDTLAGRRIEDAFQIHNCVGEDAC